MSEFKCVYAERENGGTPRKTKENGIHFHHLILFSFRKSKIPLQRAKMIGAVYGEGAIASIPVCK